MTSESAAVADTLFGLIEFLAVGFALRYTLRQRMTRLHDAKALLVAAHVFILSNFILEFLRQFESASLSFMQFYAVATVSLILWTGVALTALAYIIYFRPPEQTLGERLVALATKRFIPFGFGMLMFISYLASVDAFLIASRPFTIVGATDWTGATGLIPRFDANFIVLGAVAFGLFLLFPSTQYVLAVRKIPDPSARRAVAVFVGGWDLIAFDSLLLFGFLPALGIDLVAPGQLVAGLLLLTTGWASRKRSMLEELFKPLKGAVLTSTSARQGDGPRSIYGVSTLLDADPSSNYENAVRDFADDMMSRGRLVCIFTSKSNPVYMKLHGAPGARFFILSDTSYPKPGETAGEMVVPRADRAVLLNVMDEAVSLAPDQPKAVVFDNISEMILDFGFEESYKFLRQANEILGGGNVSSFFIMFARAHDEKVQALVKNLYSGHLAYDTEGLHVVKG